VQQVYNSAMDLHNPVTVMLLVAVLMGTVGSLALALSFFSDGQRAEAWRVLKVWAVCAGVYLGFTLTVAIRARPPLMMLGTPYCDDDLCMTVLAVKKEPAWHGLSRYSLNVRLSSRAIHELRGLNEVLVYLDSGHWGAHSTSDHPLAFDTPLEPGQSMETWLNFWWPPDEGKSTFEMRLDRISYNSFPPGSQVLTGKPIMKLAME
jgi:hypothetical protein